MGGPAGDSARYHCPLFLAVETAAARSSQHLPLAAHHRRPACQQSLAALAAKLAPVFAIAAGGTGDVRALAPELARKRAIARPLHLLDRYLGQHGLARCPA